MAQVTGSDWKKRFEALWAEYDQNPASTASDLAELERDRVHWLGRSSLLTGLLKELKNLLLNERRDLGPKAQELKSRIEADIAARKSELEQAALDSSLSGERIDVTRPAFRRFRGRPHPLSSVTRRMTDILALMGFSWAEGPFLETERHNFEALNIPAHHPARDMLDTFYLEDFPLLMRTHTSPVQIRAMEARQPPLRIVCPGRVFRHEEIDASHSSAFHQIEGLAVDQDISFADLKGTLDVFLKELFGTGTETRYRPSYFPFTEPSAEVDVKCLFCRGGGCPACKKTGWMEILGAGVVHPNVFKAVGYGPERWSGFAFGVGVERVAMLLLGVSDMRLFYENDERFLAQFDEDIV